MSIALRMNRLAFRVWRPRLSAAGRAGPRRLAAMMLASVVGVVALVLIVREGHHVPPWAGSLIRRMLIAPSLMITICGGGSPRRAQRPGVRPARDTPEISTFAHRAAPSNPPQFLGYRRYGSADNRANERCRNILRQPCERSKHRQSEYQDTSKYQDPHHNFIGPSNATARGNSKSFSVLRQKLFLLSWRRLFIFMYLSSLFHKC
ncbi:MAG TPA: hypothetical protein VJY15_23535 [Candidatus Acidoferrum sp.]|nr:hypothetical protein [Candidatus Acidoferrum sp.]